MGPVTRSTQFGGGSIAASRMRLLVTTSLAGGVIAGMMVFAPTPAKAQIWNGTTDNNWSVGTNWSTGVVPGAADPANLTNGAPANNPNLTVATSIGTINQTTNTLFLGGQTLSVGTSYTISGGTISGPGTVALGAGAFFNITGNVLNLDPNATISGGAVAGGTFRVSTPGGGSTINGILAGTGASLTSNNNGFVTTLFGANTYTGGTTVIAGGVRAGTDTAFGSGAITLNDNTSLFSVGNRSIANDVVLAGGATAILNNNAGTNFTINGVVSGANGLSTFGPGTVTLTGANTYTTTAVGSGTLSIGNGGTTGTLGTGAATVSAGANLTFNRSDATTVSNAITGAGSVTLTGGGLTQLSSAGNTFSGGLNLTNGGVLGVATGTTFGTGGITVSGAGNQIQAQTSQTVANATTINPLAGLSLLANGGATLTMSGSLTVSNGSQLTVGSPTFGGTVVLANSATLSIGTPGALALNGGTLRIDNGLSGALLSAFSSSSIAAGATLDINSNSPTLRNLSGAGTITNGGVAQSVGLFNSAATTFAGVLQDGAGALGVAKLGTGTLILSGVNTYTGVTTINAGAIEIGAANNIGAGAVAINGGTLRATNSFALANAVNTTNASSTIDTGANTLTLNGALGGATSFTKTGAGTLVLTNTGTHTGGLTLQQGTLSLQTNVAAGFGTITTTGSVIDYANGVTNAAAININSDTTQLQVLAGTATQSGVISETTPPRPLEKIGAGTLVVTGANTYTGLTTVTAGALNIQNATGLGTTAGGTLVQAGASLELQNGVSVGAEALTLNGSGIGVGGALRNVSGNNVYAGAITLGSAVNIGATAGQLTIDGTVANGGNLLTVVGAGDVVFNNAISGTEGLTKSGTGAVTLAGANTYTGQTIANSGQLNLAGGAAIADTGALLVNSPAVLNLLASETVGSLAGSGLAFLNANTLTAGGNNTSTIYSGAIVGTGGLTKTGTGTMTLSGSNNYDGLTTVAAGVLQIQNNNGLGSAVGGTVVQAGAALVLANNITVAGAETLTLNGSGVGGAGALQSQGNNAFNGPITLASAATIGATAGGLLLNGPINNGGNLLTLRSDAVITANGVISGAGGLTKEGGSNAVLAGANTYTGTTTVDNGSLLVSGGAAIADAGTVVVNSPGVLRVISAETIGSLAGSGVVTLDTALTTGGNNASTTFSGQLNGASGITKTGTGTFTLTGNNIYAGATTISNGTLSIGGGGTTGAINGASAVAIGAGGTLAVNRSDAITLANTISGAGPLNQIGTGTTTLTGANTYSGVTTISAGTLQIGAGGTAGTLGTGNVVDNGTLAFNRSDTLVVANAISGTGALNQIGTGTTVLTGANSYSGTTTISAGTLQIGNNGTTGTLGTGGVVNNAALAFNRDNTPAGFLLVDNAISGSGAVNVLTGNVDLRGANTYSGLTTISAGATLGVGSGIGGGVSGTLGTGAVVNDGRINLNRSGATTVGNAISGVGGVSHFGTGTTILTGANTYSGTTNIAAGTLQVGAGGTTGTLGTGDIVSLNAAGTLAFNRSDAITVANSMTSGAGTINQIGTGATTLSGNLSVFTGTTNVNAGSLLVTGQLGGTVNVNSGGTLGGTGSVSSAGLTTTVNSGGTLAAGLSPGTLSILGNLSLASGSISAFELNTTQVVGGATNDLINVGGNLAIANGAVLNVGPAVSGYYRLFNVGGAITPGGGANLGFTTINTAPGTTTASVYTSSAAPNQVNLALSNGGQLVQAWDGADFTGAAAGGQGGPGTWNAANTNWAENPAGVINDFWRSQVGFFGGAAGAVTVAGAQSFQGLQFATDGYALSGGSLNMTGNSVAGGNALASFLNINGGVTATINSVVSSAAGIGLDKLGGGTLVLTAANTFTGLTDVQAGVLRITNAGALGAGTGAAADATRVRTGAALELTGGITVANERLFLNGAGIANGGALRSVAGANAWNGPITLETASRINADAGTLTLGGAIGGAGQNLTVGGAGNTVIGGVVGTGAGTLTHDGAGTLTLNGVNTFTGLTSNTAGTLVNNGTLAGDLSNTATATNNGFINGGVGNGGAFTNTNTVNGRVTNTGTVANSGTVNGGLTNNAGTTTNTGTINAGAVNAAGATLITSNRINGGLTNDGTVQAQGDVRGAVINQGAGTFTVTGALVGDNTFTNSGTAQLNVTGGSFTGISALTNSSTAALGVNVTAGNTLGTATVQNNAGATFTSVGTVNATTSFTNAGTANMAGALNTPLVANSGAFNVTGNLVNGTAGNAFNNTGTGTLGVSGGNFTGLGALTNSSTAAVGVNVAATRTLTTVTTQNNAGSTLTSAGTLNATTSFTNAGTANMAGTLTTPLVANSGAFNVTGNLGGATGAFNNTGTGTLGVTGGDFTGVGALTNSSTAAAGVNVAATRTLTTVTILNSLGSTFGSVGTVNATTSLTNAGTANMAGTLTTPLVANSGAFNITGNLGGATGAFNNTGTGTLAVTGGDFTGVGALTNSSTAAPGVNVASERTLTTATTQNNAGSTLTSTGTLNATTSFTNAGTANMAGTLTSPLVTNSGLFSVTGLLGGATTTFSNSAGATTDIRSANFTGVGTFNNAGTLLANGGGARTLGAGTFNNLATGVITQQQAAPGAVGDVLTITGNYAGTAGSRILQNVNLGSNAGGAANGDRIVVNGTATGQTNFSFNPVNGGRTIFANPIPVFVAAGGAGGMNVNEGRFERSGFFDYFLRRSPGGAGFEITSQFNSGPVSGVASGLSGVISGLQAGFHQPASAIISRPDDCKPNQLMGGPFIRVSTGETNIKTSSAGDLQGGGNPFTGNTKSNSRFNGFQTGFDVGLCNINDTNWNIHVGVMGGLVDVSSTGNSRSPTPVAGVDSLTRTKADANVPFVGAYAFVTNGPFTAEINVRRDIYDLKLSTTDPSTGFQFVGPGQKLKGDGISFNAAMSYRFTFLERYYIEPAIGVSKSTTSFGLLPFATGGSDFMQFNTSDSVLGRAGVNIGGAFQLTENLAVAPFIHASVWREFGGRLKATAFIGSSGQSFNVSSDRIGTFGQVGAGVQFKILNTPFLGFVRGDIRFGDKVEGKALNAGLRLQF